MSPAAPQHDPDEPPPILGSWRALYLALIVELLLISAASCLLTWWAS
jgi:hypothetical protein